MIFLIMDSIFTPPLSQYMQIVWKTKGQWSVLYFFLNERSPLYIIPRPSLLVNKSLVFFGGLGHFRSVEKYLIVVLWSLMDCRMGSAVRADPYKVVILRSEPPSLDSPPPHLHLNLISNNIFPLSLPRSSLSCEYVDEGFSWHSWFALHGAQTRKVEMQGNKVLDVLATTLLFNARKSYQPKFKIKSIQPILIWESYSDSPLPDSEHSDKATQKAKCPICH